MGANNGRITEGRDGACAASGIGGVLDLLEADISENPGNLIPLSQGLLERVRALTDGVSVDLAAPLPADERPFVRDMTDLEKAYCEAVAEETHVVARNLLSGRPRRFPSGRF